ncbi:hypothetical protein BDQ12DRAFT_44200 [Crucibulum laeve]|uniref:DH domain-containing protein n=1 Tax=Crucibulum laeve TaxID=68775 RepID=A0A5C3MI13_9AGAR|nr:hypothetical protein BDQ12DRAFT_44200 [Crucibulum laeve]
MASVGKPVEPGVQPSEITSPMSTTAAPRSRRVGMASPPSQFRLSALIPNSSSPPSTPTSPTFPSSPSASPPLPPRSPLRPQARSLSIISSSSNAPSSFSHLSYYFNQTSGTRPNTPPPLDSDDFAAIAESAIPLSFQMHDRDSFPSMHTLVDSVNSVSEDNILSKALPLRPDSPLSLSLLDDESASSSSSVAQQPPMTKRHHALHELLSSERAYASDLALIREVHIPLALGQQIPIHNLPASPPNSSASSSRTLSVASDSSTGSLGPPMTTEDTKIIFSNIAELAVFSDLFCEELEAALGAVVEGGQGDDRVGELFLRIIPDLERPYKQYITRHPTALTHLQSLPQTPALAAYLQHTQTVASSLSHAWDLSSLLIKPVQRLLKYPLLLGAIIDETPEAHPDKENLKLARTRMEEVARNVNEGRRRAEVIKDVLSSKKKPLNVSVAASVNLSKMKSLRYGGSRAQQLADGNGEGAQVERMQVELKQIDQFAQTFARNVVDWAKMMSKVMLSLRLWALGFGRVIGLSAEQGSEAFEAFLAVVEQQLLPLCVELEGAINERVLKELAKLLTTMNQPLKLLASMDDQEPFHYHLLTMNVSAKNRPPPALLAASTNYLALRGQLAAELPQYLTLLHRGMAIFVRRFADIQTYFWGDVRERWADLWDMLRVEGELNAGHQETINVWMARWGDVDEVMAALNINQARKLYQEPAYRAPAPAVHSMLSSLDPPHSTYGKKQQHAPSVVSMLSSLEPVHVMGPVSGPMPLAPFTPSVKTRNRGSSDAASTYGTRPSINRRTSNDSFHSGKSNKAKSPRRHQQHQQRAEEYAEHVAEMPTASVAAYNQIPRTKSMPLPSADKASSTSTRRPTSSRMNTSTGAGGAGGYVYTSYPYGYAQGDGDSRRRSPDPYDERERERGRTSQSPSYKRKSAEAPPPRRPSNTRQRSGSVKSITSFFHSSNDVSSAADPAPISNAQRDSWVNKPAKYVCQVVHPCKPPAAVSYFSFPFFTLVEEDLYEVLQEAGHPSIHPKLPLYVDDGEDCLLLCRDGRGNVGWALASFLEPISLTD